MSYVKVHAYVRSFCMERVEQRLMDLGIGGFSYCRVQGLGEYANYYKHDLLVEHARFEIFIPEERAEEVVEAIMDTAGTHQKGDGVVAVMPVTHFYWIRTEAEIGNPESGDPTRDSDRSPSRSAESPHDLNKV